ncbi:hypothetical protein [Hufsiella ginkgonis]|nr:hypothetical protein [Hufsiella ginkgonis]
MMFASASLLAFYLDGATGGHHAESRKSGNPLSPVSAVCCCSGPR